MANADVERLRNASRRLVRELGFLRDTLAGVDLPPSAVHALVEIGGRKAVTAGALAEILMLEKSSVSRMLRKLIDSGEICEGAGARDGRTKPLFLTAKGRATLARIDAFATRQIIGAFNYIDPDRRQIVIDGIHSYAEALQADRTGVEGPRDGVESRSRR